MDSSKGSFVTRGFIPKLLLVQIAAALAATSTHDASAAEKKKEEAGVKISGGVTMISQQYKWSAELKKSEQDSGKKVFTGYSGVSTISVDLNFEKEVGDGKVFVYVNNSVGSDPGIRANADFEGPSGTTATGDRDEGFGTSRIAEAWYERPLNDMVTATVGKIDPHGLFDTNAFANDQTTQFIGGPFVNNPAIDFPGHLPYHAFPMGVQFAAEVSDGVKFNVGYFEDTQSENEGTFAHSFTAAGIDFAHEIAGRDANIRVLTWRGKLANKASGVALSFDMAINDDLGVFARYGSRKLADTPTEDADLTSYKSATSFGFQYKFGDGNTFGVGKSTAKAQGLKNKSGDVIEKEDWTEAYVQHELSEDVLVAVDYQIIKNPGFDSGIGSVSVVGARLQVNF